MNNAGCSSNYLYSIYICCISLFYIFSFSSSITSIYTTSNGPTIRIISTTICFRTSNIFITSRLNNNISCYLFSSSIGGIARENMLTICSSITSIYTAFFKRVEYTIYSITILIITRVISKWYSSTINTMVISDILFV